LKYTAINSVREETASGKTNGSGKDEWLRRRLVFERVAAVLQRGAWACTEPFLRAEILFPFPVLNNVPEARFSATMTFRKTNPHEKTNPEGRKMFKVRPRLPSALLTLMLSLSIATAARAQDATVTRQTPDATPDAAEQTSAQHKPDDSKKADEQKTQQGTQSGTNGQQTSKGPAPLTAGQKVGYSFRAAFLSPSPYLTSAFSAAVTQLREDRLPHKDNADRMADWGSRAARIFAFRTTTTLFASGFYPALFRQDPRYDPSASKSFGRRTLHAASRVFVTRDDEGKLEPNYSRFAGAMTASALANIWEHNTPGHDRIGTNATLRRFAFSLATNALGNILFKEFGPDIISIFRH
jgi:hypothetical protein